MGNFFTKLKLFLGYIRCFPHLLFFRYQRNRGVIKADIEKWMEVLFKAYSLEKGLIYLLVFYPEFRNLFYYRLGAYSTFIHFLYKKKSSLYLPTQKIGAGFFIQHGDGSIIAAKSIGENCWINQGVTIGYTQIGKTPVIGDNVTINAGAKVFGDITVGDNVIIGANAVVTKNVPANCTVVGVPAYIIKKDGVKTKQSL